MVFVSCNTSIKMLFSSSIPWVPRVQFLQERQNKVLILIYWLFFEIKFGFFAPSSGDQLIVLFFFHHYKLIDIITFTVHWSIADVISIDAQNIQFFADGSFFKLPPWFFQGQNMIMWILMVKSILHLFSHCSARPGISLSSKDPWFLLKKKCIQRPQSGLLRCSVLLDWLLFLGLFSQ